jgi:DNA segregation ATPase FtsK/SpoIIIE, S-DNA-T family
MKNTDSNNQDATKSRRFLSEMRRQRLVRGLEHRLTAHRQEMEAFQLKTELQKEALLADYRLKLNQLVNDQSRQIAESITDWDEARESLWSHRDRNTLNSLRQETRKSRELQDTHQVQRQQLQTTYKQSREKLEQQYEELKPKPAKQLERYLDLMNQHSRRADQAIDDFQQLAAARNVSLPQAQAPTALIPDDGFEQAATVLETVQRLVDGILQSYQSIQKSFLVRFSGSVMPWLIGLLPGIACGLLAWLLLKDKPLVGIGISLGALVLGPIILVFSLIPQLKRQMSEPFRSILEKRDRVEKLSVLGKDLAEAQRKAEEQRLWREFQERLKQLEADHLAKLAQLDSKLKVDLEQLQASYRELRKTAASDCRSATARLDSEREPTLAALGKDQSLTRDKEQQLLDESRSRIEANALAAYQSFEERIRLGTSQALKRWSDEAKELASRFPSWSAAAWTQGTWERQLETATLPIGFCQMTVGDQFSTNVPIVFDWLRKGVLIVEGNQEERQRKSQVVQALLARAFCALPMGRFQATIIDPEGLGRDFAWLMPLADIDPRLVSHRVWTQNLQIAEQLSLLAYQTEDIIQQRLRDRYQNLLDYNAEAGPMAEPMRLIVWSNFPFGLDEGSWRSLCSILASGPRCGIGVILTVDPGHPWPPFVEPEKLHAFGMRIKLGSPVRLIDRELDRFPLFLDEPPSPDVLATVIEHCRQAAIEADKIEVPFETISVEAKDIGKTTSFDALAIPLGVAGVGRVTSLRLGHGTAQHVLIAGKTGSGKSSLLHTLITSAALKYSPSELRMVLLDFKKGVEFQVYAQAKLPHAEIIGIESRREFGLSALEYLDRVLHRRGEMFREAGVQDIPSWHRQRPNQPMPRVLVVIDEFQEIFIEDDKLAQQAAMLLDRVVRQGRSFGIHIVMASQTIGGSFSLPRTTMAQMAVRIALQCDAGDAMMILGEDNLAATRLRHSGQAIYNDAGGRIESNQPFQVAYIRAGTHVDQLSQIHDRQRPDDPSTNLLGRQIVFEGHRPAIWNREDIDRSLALLPKPESGAMQLLLGESLSIEPPVARSLIRQNGRNLVIVGNQQSLAANLIATIVRGWTEMNSVGQPPEVYYIDGTRAEDAEAASLRPWLAQQSVQTFEPRAIDEAIQKLYQELELRLAAPDEQRPTIALIVANLGRLRELRKSEEFSFGSSNAGATIATDEAFAKILRDGPPLGMHCLVWSDSWGTLSRFIPRQGLRDLEVRILMPMSANDSNQLIDSSAANKLEDHAMIYFDEADGKIVKFRPYQIER